MSDNENDGKRSGLDEGLSPKKKNNNINFNNDSTQVDELVLSQTQLDTAPVYEECSICLEPGTDQNPIVPHGCPKCNKDAWKICECCNETRLSRNCPMCRSEYAPLVFHLMPGAPFYLLADKDISSAERTKLLYKFGIVRHLIGRSNVIVWSKEKQRLYFSLPQSLTTTSPTDDASYAVASIPYDSSLIESSDTFYFTNSIWDKIEDTVETGEIQAGDFVNLKDAQAYIISVTKEKDHKLFTMMTPDDWNFILDPSADDTSEALNKIRSSVLNQALDGFMNKENKEVDDENNDENNKGENNEEKEETKEQNKET